MDRRRRKLKKTEKVSKVWRIIAKKTCGGEKVKWKNLIR